MESLALTDFWRGRRVLLTGHTGFMGGWLTALLSRHGASVHGYALEPPTEPSFFTATDLASHMHASTRGDVRDPLQVTKTIRQFDPEIIFHLAAQPLVRKAFAEPIETFATNVMGTAHLLDAVRSSSGLKAAIVVTTDKVYLNANRRQPYAEDDRLGGREAYSASKVAAELVAEAWRHNYLAKRGVGVATIRAGNIFGGGDWAEDRLVPDAVRAFSAGRPLVLRHPQSTRPWQHVLDPLPGYLTLAERLAGDPIEFSGAWNFGPSIEDCRPVGELAQLIAAAWDEADVEVRVERGDGIFEETLLSLDSSKAHDRLGWRPRWPLETAAEQAVAWYRAFSRGQEMWSFTQSQIREFESAGSIAA